MTKFYADGRPAQEGGKPVRYDAGGRAHVAGESGGDLLYLASRTDVLLQLNQVRIEKVYLQETLKTIADVAKRYPGNMPESSLWATIAALCDLALDVTEEAS